MRIISKSKDYYDSCRALGFDPDLIWIREPTEIPKAKTPFDNIRVLQLYGFAYKSPRGALHFQFLDRAILFCGKLYPCIEVVEVNTSTEPQSTQKHYFYCVESFEEFVKELGHTLDNLAHHHSLDPISRRGKPGLISWFNSFELLQNKALNWSLETRTVCAAFPFKNPNSEHRSDAVVRTNPLLKEFAFFKVFDAPSAFQEISMFVGGILPSTSSVPIAISDKDRLIQHGFDKHSFRKKKGA